jgi:hydrogenase maturation protease
VGIKTAVLGIGNLLLRDEGVGVHAVRALGERYAFPAGVEIIDGGTMGLDLLPFIEGRDALLIIDAVDFSAGPGTIRTMEGSGIKAFLDIKFSVHQIGLPDMLFAAALRGSTPPRLSLVGIQPGRVETGLEMSPAVMKRFDELIDTAVGILRSWGHEIMEKEPENVPGSAFKDNTP